MKALSVRQPWALEIDDGIKRLCSLLEFLSQSEVEVGEL